MIETHFHVKHGALADQENGEEELYEDEKMVLDQMLERKQ